MKHTLKTLACIVAIAAITTACAPNQNNISSGSSSSSNASTSSVQASEASLVEKTITDAMTALSKGDGITFDKLVVFPNENKLGNFNLTEDAAKSAENKKIKEDYDTIMKHITYTIDSTQVTGETATVKMTVTNMDSISLIKEIMTKAIANPKIMDNKDNIMPLIADYTKTLEFPVTLTLNKKDGKWVAEGNKEFVNALTGGLLESEFFEMFKNSGLLFGLEQ